MVTLRVLIAGLIASIVMGMIEMLYELVAGAGFWSPMVFIAATILRAQQTVLIPVPFMLVPVVLGLMGHMMNSVIFGIIFAVLVASRLRGLGPLLVAGVVYSLVVFVVMWFGVVPLVDPVMLHLNPVAFAISHVMWGAALGLVLGWQQEKVA
jgi:hypothetical protein